MQKNHGSCIIICGFVQIGEEMPEFYAAQAFIWVWAVLARKLSAGSAVRVVAGVQNCALVAYAPY